MDRFIIVDGKVVEKEDVNLTHLILDKYNEISQQFWYGFGGIPLFKENIDLIKSQLNTLNVPVPKLLNNQNELFRVTKRMLNKNKFYRSGYIYLRIFRNNNEVKTLVSSTAFNEFEFPISEEGILVNFASLLKPVSTANKLPFYNLTFWNLAQAELNTSEYQNSILLNENHAICESIRSNIFMIKGFQLFTPSIKAGCYNDVLRSFILEIASDLGYTIFEPVNISKTDILQMNEIFIAAEAFGIQWILGIEKKRFRHQASIQIQEKLNELLKNKVN